MNIILVFVADWSNVAVLQQKENLAICVSCSYRNTRSETDAHVRSSSCSRHGFDVLFLSMRNAPLIICLVPSRPANRRPNRQTWHCGHVVIVAFAWLNWFLTLSRPEWCFCMTCDHRLQQRKFRNSTVDKDIIVFDTLHTSKSLLLQWVLNERTYRLNGFDRLD